MSGPLEILLIGAAVVAVVVRLFRPSQVGQGRWWVLPVVLGFLALREPGLLDSHHEGVSVALLVMECFVGLVTGLGWAWTSRIWAQPDGTVWARGTKAAGAVWVGGILVRLALYGVGSALDIRQDSSALLLGLAVTFLARGVTLTYRAGLIRPAYGVSAPAAAAAPAAPAASAAWKDRV